MGLKDGDGKSEWKKQRGIFKRYIAPLSEVNRYLAAVLWYLVRYLGTPSHMLYFRVRRMGSW